MKYHSRNLLCFLVCLCLLPTGVGCGTSDDRGADKPGTTQAPAPGAPAQSQANPPDHKGLYDKAKELVKLSRARLLDKFTDQQGAELVSRVKANLDKAKQLENEYRSLRAAGKDDRQLDAVAADFAAAVLQMTVASRSLLDRISAAKDDLEGSLLAMVFVDPARAQAEIDEIKKLLEPLSAHLDTLRETSRVVVPVIRAARQGIDQRIQAGETRTPELEAEEHLKACREHLERGKDQPSTAAPGQDR